MGLPMTALDTCAWFGKLNLLVLKWSRAESVLQAEADIMTPDPKPAACPTS